MFFFEEGHYTFFLFFAYFQPFCVCLRQLRFRFFLFLSFERFYFGETFSEIRIFILDDLLRYANDLISSIFTAPCRFITFSNFTS